MSLHHTLWSNSPWANCVLFFTLLKLFVRVYWKQITVGVLSKSGERHCCNNSRVKGVNMRREFHAWQVRHMAPVFLLFTRANEQTWAQPCLPAALNWQGACLCVSHLPLQGSPCVIISHGCSKAILFLGWWGFSQTLSTLLMFVAANGTQFLLETALVPMKLHWNASCSHKLPFSCSKMILC